MNSPLRATVVVPVFNDWMSFARLVEDLELALADCNVTLRVIAVDDASWDEPSALTFALPPKVVQNVDVLHLGGNHGHQRAIAIGIVEAWRSQECDVVVVMDGDGEDQPSELARLCAAFRAAPGSIVVASRAKRSEGLSFRAFYYVYKACFRILTGKTIDFGNFCLIPAPHLRRLVNTPDLWNHLAATLVRTRLPMKSVPTVRGLRYHGEPKMNLVSLIIHGLSATSVFSDAILVRVLLATTVLGGLVGVVAVSLLLLRILTDWTPPGWTSMMIFLLAIILFQALIGCGGAIFLYLQRRVTPLVIPVEVAGSFVIGTSNLFSVDSTGSAAG